MRTRPGSPPGSHAHLSFRKLSIIQSGSIFINQVKHNKKKTQLKAKAAPNYINIETHAQHTHQHKHTHTHAHSQMLEEQARFRVCWTHRRRDEMSGASQHQRYRIEHQTKCIFNFTRVFSIHRQKMFANISKNMLN